MEEALKEPNYLRRLGTRAEYALHAAVGLDTRKRDEMERILGERLSGQEVTLEERTDLSLSLAALGDVDSRNARQAAATLTQAMTKTTDPAALQYLAQGLSAVAARLEPKEAARVSAAAAATLTQAIPRRPTPMPSSIWRRACRNWRPAWNPRRRPSSASRHHARPGHHQGEQLQTLLYLEKGLSAVAAPWNPRRRPEVPPPPRSPRP